MCSSPIPMEFPGKSELVNVPCRKCRSCVSDQINDHTARGVCEANYRDWAVCLTLTYRDQEDGSHRRITKEHFQAALKRLRTALVTKAKKEGANRQSRLTYVVAGEYGELKNRAHFHVVLFGDGPKPDGLPQKERCWPTYFWDKGHVFADWQVDAKAIRYVCKYLHKFEGTETWISRSNRQPLGWDYQQARIDRMVEDNVFPQDWLYTVPGWNKKGRMSDATKRKFIIEFLRQWVLERGRAIKWQSLSETVYNGLQTTINWLWRQEAEAQMGLTEFIAQIRDELDARRMTEEQAFFKVASPGEQMEVIRYGKEEKGPRPVPRKEDTGSAKVSDLLKAIFAQNYRRYATRPYRQPKKTDRDGYRQRIRRVDKSDPHRAGEFGNSASRESGENGESSGNQ